MNATQTAIVTALTDSNSYHTVAELIEMTGKGDTTVRTALKVLIADDIVGKLVEDGKTVYTVIPEVPESSISVGAFLDSVLASETPIETPADVAPHVAAATTTQPAPVDVETAPEPVETETDPVAPVAETEPVKTAPVPPKAKKKYQRHDKPQTRTTRTNQITKAQIGVRNLVESPDARVTEKWYAICLTHNEVHGEDKLKDAHWFSTYPSFCSVCGPQLTGKEGRRRKLGLADKPAV